jgi:outer membrane protein OmpA-like peptidoglycan-associated protein
MIHRFLAPALAIAALGLSLSGCTTQHIKPPPSQAILQARATQATRPATCAPGGLEAVSPLDAAFGFDDATVGDVGHKRLAAAARWLGCNPGVEVAILPDADNHGDPAHQDDLAQRRAKAVADDLRGLGAKDAVIHLLARGAPDPVKAPHLVINATGRGW